MAFIIGLYLLVDVWQHKGQARVLFPKDFPAGKGQVLQPKSKSTLMYQSKSWKKAAITKERIEELTIDDAGFECDVYFDTITRSFNVYHDADKSTGFTLDNLLNLYQQRKLRAGIWLDIKNLNDSNAVAILHSLIELRDKYYLQNRMLIESGRPDLLTAFSDSSFFTSYYIPFFNPYKLNDKQTKMWADSIASLVVKSKINALSGYYFQSSFLNHYFPQYPILTWIDKSSFSLVNILFQTKIASEKSIFIVLKP